MYPQTVEIKYNAISSGVFERGREAYLSNSDVHDHVQQNGKFFGVHGHIDEWHNNLGCLTKLAPAAGRLGVIVGAGHWLCITKLYAEGCEHFPACKDALSQEEES